VPPVPHLDVCGLVKDAVKVVDAIGDDGDKTTVHDKALTGCLADGCLCHGTGFLPLVKQGSVPSNSQLCGSSVDGHQCQMLGMFPCATMVERTVHIKVAMTLEANRTQATMEMNASVDCTDHSSSKNWSDFTPKLCGTVGNCSICMQQDGYHCQQSHANFLIGDATSETTKLSRYQKLNQRHWEQKQKKKMDGDTTISGSNPKHPPVVATILATGDTNDINAVQQPAQLVPVENNDVGVPQNDLSCMDGSVAEPRTKGKNICQNHWHQDARAQEMTKPSTRTPQ